MAMLSEPYFHNEEAAYSFCESRLWPGGPLCPHCRSPGGKVGKLKGKSTRRGTYKCYACCRPFTVKIGTVIESSHLDLHLWLQAIYLVAWRALTVRQLQQTLGIGLKTAWSLNHRIRELIAQDDGPRAVLGEHRSAAGGETGPDAGPDNPDQSNRFIAKAQELEVRAGLRAFEKVFRKVALGQVSHPQPKRRRKRPS